MDGRLPRYIEIRQALESRIVSGDWAPGHPVPSELTLAALYGCSRMTVNKALSALSEAGLIARKRRSGSVVAVPRSEETILEIHDIKAEVAASGKPYRHLVLSRATRPARAEDARRLEVSVEHACERLLALQVDVRNRGVLQVPELLEEPRLADLPRAA